MELLVNNKKFKYDDKCKCHIKKSHKPQKIKQCLPCDAIVADYIIVGFGTSGATLARFLSDNFNNRVLVIEAGIDHRGDPLVEGGFGALPVGASELTASSKYAISKLVPEQQNASTTGILFLTERYSSGKGSGGSSAHNYMLAVRGTADVYDQWALISSNPLWSYDNLLPVMKGLENFVFIDGSPGITQNPAERHQGGPIQNTQIPFNLLDPRIQAFSAALGTPTLPDYNVRSGEIASSFIQGFVYPTPPGFPRSYAMTAFFPLSILDSQGNGVGGRNLKVLFETTALKVIFDQNKTAVGIAYLTKDKQTKIACATTKVILSAGAPLSSGILQHSGIGPAAVLTKAGVPVILDNPNVGNNLTVHYGPTAYFTLQQPLPILLNLISFATGQPYFNSTQRELEILTANGTSIVQSTNASVDVVRALNITAYGSSTIWDLRPASRGSAFIVDGNFYDLPDIRYNLYSNPRDAQVLIAGLRIVRDAVHAIGETMIYPPEIHFTDPNSDVLLLEDILVQLPHGQATNHYVNTAAMGSVVDGNLNVIGVQNLMVADLSIAPVIPTGNTAWAAYYIGANAARILGAVVPVA